MSLVPVIVASGVALALPEPKKKKKKKKGSKKSKKTKASAAVKGTGSTYSPYIVQSGYASSTYQRPPNEKDAFAEQSAEVKIEVKAQLESDLKALSRAKYCEGIKKLKETYSWHPIIKNYNCDTPPSQIVEDAVNSAAVSLSGGFSAAFDIDLGSKITSVAKSIGDGAKEVLDSIKFW